MTYEYPETDDVDWGPEATDWAQAVTSGMLQKAGGLFQLLSEADFGSAYGLKSLYYKSRTANVASAGQIRLARADVVAFRNQANSADINLAVDSSNNLTWNGNILGVALNPVDTDSIDLTSAGGDLSADLRLSAAAAASGFLKITNTIETDGLLGVLPIADGSTTGALSSTDWTTFNGKQAAGSYITALTGDVTASGPGSVASTITPGIIVNAMINASAAIAYSKLNLSGSILNADINASAAIAYSKLNLSSSIVNADVSASAAIAFSKLASLTSANILVGSAGNVATSTAVTGDISLSNTGVTAYSGTVPLNKGGTGQTTKAAAFDALSPLTTGGQLIYGGASGTGTPLANGSIGQALLSGGGTAAPTWGTPVIDTVLPSVQKFTSGSGTYNKNYTFVITSGSATAGATYTNNAVTFTVHQTVASATLVVMNGSGAPASSGTLTKSAGTGDSTLTFSQVFAPLYLKVKMAGGGGGGGGSGTGSSGGTGGTGGTTTFGSSLLTAVGGVGGQSGNQAGGTGGAVTVSSPAISLVSVTGGIGGSGQGSIVSTVCGGNGGNSIFGGGGGGGPAAGGSGTVGTAGAVNTGGGGGGAGNWNGSGYSGSGGGAGSGIEAIIPSPSATYAYAVGAAGTAGAATTSGTTGGAGGSGVVVVEEYYK